MRARDARLYIEQSSISLGAKERILSVIDRADLDRELSAAEEQEIHTLLDEEVRAANAAFTLIQEQIEELEAQKRALESDGGEVV
jgi:hypothetical protein